MDRLASKSASWHVWGLAFAMPLVLSLPVYFMREYGQLQSTMATVSGVTLLLAVVAAAITDLRSRKIYNWTTYTAFVWGLAINLVGALFHTGDSKSALAFVEPDRIGPAFLGAVGLGQSLSGAAACFGVMIVAFVLARGGAGDVKIGTAIGALLGVRHGVLAIAFAYIAAAAFLLIAAVWRQGPINLVTAFTRWIGFWIAPHWVAAPTKEQKLMLEQPLPLGAFFAVGAVAVLIGVGQRI